ncbi:MAG: hypothetical protein AB7S56_01400 [Halothiobacillaceae bacterium]
MLCTFTLGTAAGDLANEALGLGITLGTLAFSAALGDLLTHAKTYGGLGMGTLWTIALFLSVIVMLVAVAQIGGMNGKRSAQAAEQPSL